MDTTLHTTREAAEIINAANILPVTKALSPRSVARLCKRQKLPGSYLVQGDWCIPQATIDKFIAQTKRDTNGRPPRKKKTT